MTLLAQKVNQNISTMGELIQTGGDISELTFGTDIVEINRKQTHQLFAQIVYLFNIAV